MKTLRSIPLGRLQETIATLDDPQCWGMQVYNWEYTLKRWPSRSALARTVRMQEKRERKPGDWRAVVPLTDGEGY